MFRFLLTFINMFSGWGFFNPFTFGIIFKILKTFELHLAFYLMAFPGVFFGFAVTFTNSNHYPLSAPLLSNFLLVNSITGLVRVSSDIPQSLSEHLTAFYQILSSPYIARLSFQSYTSCKGSQVPPLFSYLSHKSIFLIFFIFI